MHSWQILFMFSASTCSLTPVEVSYWERLRSIIVSTLWLIPKSLNRL